MQNLVNTFKELDAHVSRNLPQLQDTLKWLILKISTTIVKTDLMEGEIADVFYNHYKTLSPTAENSESEKQ